MIEDRKSISNRIKKQLSIFDRIGIASANQFEDVKHQNHPKKYIKDFRSVIVYAAGKDKSDSESMGGFSDYLGIITAQAEVMSHLASLGYDSVVMDNKHNDISLVRMGIEAGLGEISPVDSLVIEGLGLTATLGAIVTNAPLVADEKVSNVCIQCDNCLQVCPIRVLANAKGDLSKCACGACVNLCPV